MTRSDLRAAVRDYLRQLREDPFSDTAVNTALERAADEITRQADWAVVEDYFSSVVGQREIALPLDIVRILSCSFQPGAGTQLATAIASDDPGEDGVLTVLSTTGFDAAGTLKIEAEEITYTGITATAFTGVSRGANDTDAAAHSEGEGVVDATIAFRPLMRTTPAELDRMTPAWRSQAPGTPTYYYTYPAKLGFDRAPDKPGYWNLKLDTSIRPELFASDTSDPDFLWVPFHDLLALGAAAALARRLASDEAYEKQAKEWEADFARGIALLRTRSLGFESAEFGRVAPNTGRI